MANRRTLLQKYCLDVSDLMMFGEVCWLNAAEDMLIKNASTSKESTTFVRAIDCLCFVFRHALLLAVNQSPGKKTCKKSKVHFLSFLYFQNDLQLVDSEFSASKLLFICRMFT